MSVQVLVTKSKNQVSGLTLASTLYPVAYSHSLIVSVILEILLTYTLVCVVLQARHLWNLDLVVRVRLGE